MTIEEGALDKEYWLGFQKGKLQAQKEELVLLESFILHLPSKACILPIIEKRIKQLQKELGGKK